MLNREENQQTDLIQLILSALDEEETESGWGAKYRQFDFVLPNLAVGGCAYNKAQRLSVVNAGITHILDCRIERSDRNLFRKLAPQVAYKWLGTDDDGQVKEDQWFTDILAFAQKCYADGGVLLTHCAMGINRGPSAGYIVMRHIFGYDPIQALTTMQKARPHVYAAYAEDADDYLRRMYPDTFARGGGNNALNRKSTRPRSNRSRSFSV